MGLLAGFSCWILLLGFLLNSLAGFSCWVFLVDLLDFVVGFPGIPLMKLDFNGIVVFECARPQ
jgi:hypothetical protein